MTISHSKLVPAKFSEIILPDDDPYMLIGKDSLNKTSVCLDIVKSAAESNQYSSIYYVSPFRKSHDIISKLNPSDASFFAHPPKNFKQVHLCWEDLNELWRNLVGRRYILNDNKSVKVKDLILMLSKIYSRKELDHVIKSYNDCLRGIAPEKKDEMGINYLREAIVDGININGCSQLGPEIWSVAKLQKVLLVIDNLSYAIAMNHMNQMLTDGPDSLRVSTAFSYLIDEILSDSKKYGITTVLSVNSSSDFSCVFEVPNVIVCDYFGENLLNHFPQSVIDVIKSLRLDQRKLNGDVISVKGEDMYITRNIKSICANSLCFEIMNRLEYIPKDIDE